MRWPWQHRAEPAQTERQYRHNYTDAILDGDYAVVTADDERIDPSAVGMVVFGIAMYTGAFAVADVSPALPALSPDYLARVARRLLTSGDSLDAITVNRDGLALLPASTWDVYGPPDPARWRYILDLPGPSRDETVRTSADGVIHCRIGQSKYSWQGRSPLTNAGLTARMLARLETRLGDESRARAGYLLEYDPGVSKATLDKIEADVKSARGGTALAEKGGGGDPMRGHSPGWGKVRIGAEFPATNIELRRDVGRDALAALGVNPQLIAGDGSAIRESYRQLLRIAIAPMGRIVAAELTAKLDREITIGFDEIFAADVAAAARAFKSYVESGLPTAEAKELAGIGI